MLEILNNSVFCNGRRLPLVAAADKLIEGDVLTYALLRETGSVTALDDAGRAICHVTAGENLCDCCFLKGHLFAVTYRDNKVLAFDASLHPAGRLALSASPRCILHNGEYLFIGANTEHCGRVYRILPSFAEVIFRDIPEAVHSMQIDGSMLFAGERWLSVPQLRPIYGARRET